MKTKTVERLLQETPQDVKKSVSDYADAIAKTKEIQPSKAPTSAKEMFLAEPKPDVTDKAPIVKLSQEQLKDVGL